jgi:hypothetical protein
MHMGYPAGKPRSSTTADTTPSARYRVFFLSIPVRLLERALSIRRWSSSDLPSPVASSPEAAGLCSIPVVSFHFLSLLFGIERFSAPTLPCGLENFLRSKSATMISPSPRTNRLAASGSAVIWLIFNLVLKRNRTGKC